MIKLASTNNQYWFCQQHTAALKFTFENMVNMEKYGDIIRTLIQCFLY